MNNQNYIYIHNNHIKSTERLGEIGAYSVLFGTDKKKDFHGNWFTKSTFLGHTNGNGAVATINHRQPVFAPHQFDAQTEKALKAITNRPLKNPIETTVDDVGVFSKIVLDLSDKYEKMVHDLAQQGVFKWSSGTAPHLFEATKSGELKMFVIAEQALTPIPAEYRMLEHRVMPMKMFTALLGTEVKTQRNALIQQFVKSVRVNDMNNFLQSLKGGDGSGFFGHSGRPGEVGGSSSSGVSKGKKPKRGATAILLQERFFADIEKEAKRYVNDYSTDELETIAGNIYQDMEENGMERPSKELIAFHVKEYFEDE